VAAGDEGWLWERVVAAALGVKARALGNPSVDIPSPAAGDFGLDLDVPPVRPSVEQPRSSAPAEPRSVPPPLFSEELRALKDHATAFEAVLQVLVAQGQPADDERRATSNGAKAKPGAAGAGPRSLKRALDQAKLMSEEFEGELKKFAEG
jgi:hypothetical protein